MDAQIEKMIRLATVNGSLTEKEKDIIMRKAQEAGEDTDVVEVMIENFLSSSKANAKVPKVENIYKGRKCPYCGAILTEGALVCPECGHELTEESKTSVIAKDIMDIFQQQYDNLDKEIVKGDEEDIRAVRLDKERANLINNFSFPNTKEGLLQCFEFVISKYMSTSWIQNPNEKEAWKGKAHQVLSMLHRHTYMDKELKSTVDYYTKLLEKEEKKTSTYKSVFYIICLGTIIIMILGAVLSRF